jgi:hypothetical protein
MGDTVAGSHAGSPKVRRKYAESTPRRRHFPNRQTVSERMEDTPGKSG